MARQSKYLHYQMSACTHWWSGFPPLLVRPGWAWTWLTAAASSLTHPEEKEEKEKKKLEQENVRWEGRGEGLFERQSGRGRETMSGCSLCSSARGRMEVSGRGLGWFSPRVSSMWLTHKHRKERVQLFSEHRAVFIRCSQFRPTPTVEHRPVTQCSTLPFFFVFVLIVSFPHPEIFGPDYFAAATVILWLKLMTFKEGKRRHIRGFLRGEKRNVPTMY